MHLYIEQKKKGASQGS